jgi:hypothetical protein
MRTIRMNVTLPKDVAETLKELGGPRGQSSFIAESIRFYAKKLRRHQMQSELKAQYLEASGEDLDLVKDFEVTTADGLEDQE